MLRKGGIITIPPAKGDAGAVPEGLPGQNPKKVNVKGDLVSVQCNPGILTLSFPFESVIL